MEVGEGRFGMANSEVKLSQLIARFSAEILDRPNFNG